MLLLRCSQAEENVNTVFVPPVSRHEWWVPGKIVDIRRRLADNWRSSGNRDVLLLDVALDNYFRWGLTLAQSTCMQVAAQRCISKSS